MSLLAEIDLEQHYREMTGCVRSINSVWKHMNEGEQAHCKELANDLYDTWDKLQHCYYTHDEDQLEYVYALYSSILNDYQTYATWATLRK